MKAFKKMQKIMEFLFLFTSFSVVRNESFNSGSEVKLTCSNRTWYETMYVIWKIESGGRHCKIAFDSNGESSDDCRDGRSLKNTSSAQPYLHIPNFSDKDVGLYKCESAYTGGTENYENNVGIKGGFNDGVLLQCLLLPKVILNHWISSFGA